MRALIYLTKRSFINKAKRAVKKPTSLLLIIFCTIYISFISVTLGGLMTTLRVDSPKGFLVGVTVCALYFSLIGLSSCASRKGVLFKPYHARFIFPAPISPKVILLHGAWMNYLFSLIFGLIFFAVGVSVFQIQVWRMLLYLFVFCVLEVVVETSIIVCMYANEKISAKAVKCIGWMIKVALVMITLYIFLYFNTNGITIDTVLDLADLPGLQMIPLVGWNIAVYHLVLIGPTVLNVVCSCLYVLTVFLLFTVARRMKCEGGYFEDAAKFADDYAEVRKRTQNGEMVLGMKEKKKKYRRISAGFKATGARAIFYRQLLEYKKERYFIFTKMTLVSLGCALIVSQILQKQAIESGTPGFFLLGIIFYMTLIMSGYLGKWENELKSPYLFLIPDSPIKKLWYSTLMEYIKALLDGCIFCIPLGVVWEVDPVQIILSILIYIILQVNRIYIKVFTQCLLGDTLGKKGQNIMRMLMQMFLLGGGMIVAFSVGVTVDSDLVFPIILIYSIIITVIIGLLASIRFNSMEQVS